MWTIALLGLTCAAAATPASRPELTPDQRAAFARALQPFHEQYDPGERMLKRPFSSPGYHTILKGGQVHPTRDSLRYAAALLDTNEPEDGRRARDILRRVISLQDQDPDSKTYGIWSWFLEEPLGQMSPPDWNWADFCGRELLQVRLHHTHELPKDLLRELDAGVRHAARSIQRRNVGPGYTNIAILGTYVALVTAETYADVELKQYAMDRLRRLCACTRDRGAFTEYNSPTYTMVSLKGLAQLRADAKDAEARRLAHELYCMAWEEVAMHFHAPTRQWAGPHSRCYSTLLKEYVSAFIPIIEDILCAGQGRPADTSPGAGVRKLGGAPACATVTVDHAALRPRFPPWPVVNTHTGQIIGSSCCALKECPCSGTCCHRFVTKTLSIFTKMRKLWIVPAARYGCWFGA